MNIRFPAKPDEQAIKRDLAAELLRGSGLLRLQTTGRSMLPTIWPGDALVVEPIAPADVVPGDIVLFSSCSRFVAHRVIEKFAGPENAQVVTRGDAMADADAPIHEKEILGKISFILRNGRCFEPSKGLGRSERALSALFSRFQLAASVVVGIHGIRQASPVPTI